MYIGAWFGHPILTAIATAIVTIAILGATGIYTVTMPVIDGQLVAIVLVLCAIVFLLLKRVWFLEYRIYTATILCVLAGLFYVGVIPVGG
jgi:hypothetical protein